MSKQEDCDAFAKRIGQDHYWAYSPDRTILEDWAHKGPWHRDPQPGPQWRRCTNCGRMEEFTGPDTLPPCMEPDGGSCCPQYHALKVQLASREAALVGMREALKRLVKRTPFQPMANGVSVFLPFEQLDELKSALASGGLVDPMGVSDYLISDSPGCCAHCGLFHSSAKCPPQMAGRELYEADLLDRPTYHDGSPRKTWEQLSEVARWSWERKQR